MTAEEWRPVVGFPDYRVSSLGRLVSDRQWRKQRGREIGWTDSNGYRRAYLVPPTGRKVNRGVHGLILEAFVGPRPEGQEVRHLDGDPSNNTLSNLAYGTHVENMQDQARHGTHPNAVKTTCKWGHPFNEANTWIHEPTGARQCRVCRREYMAARRAGRARAAA